MRRKLASMPPMTMGTSLNASRSRCEYTMTQRSGRLPPNASRRIGIVASHPPIRGVAVDHRIHVAAGHAEEQPRRAECGEIRRAVPIRLGDDAHFETLRLEYAADDRHAETRMIYVGIAR